MLYVYNHKELLETIFSLGLKGLQLDHWLSSVRSYSEFWSFRVTDKNVVGLPLAIRCRHDEVGGLLYSLLLKILLMTLIVIVIVRLLPTLTLFKSTLFYSTPLHSTPPSVEQLLKSSTVVGHRLWKP